MPEQGCALVYDPCGPALHALNLTSWFVLTLCDGRSDAAMQQAYDAATKAAGGAGSHAAALDAALSGLAALGLIRRAQDGRG